MKRLGIAKEGLWLGGLPLITGLFFLWIGLIFLGGILFLAGIFILYFFRQPDRISVFKEGIIYAPADGRIIRIKQEYEGDFFKEIVNKVSIFMNLFNVHITYAPVCGEIEYLQYKPGNFLRADKVLDSPDEVNENNFIGIRNGNGRVAVRQVAGLVARRIVCDARLGDRLAAGERMGMIKFGSRIDVYLPKDWQINVSEGERAKAGRTVLARRLYAGI